MVGLLVKEEADGKQTCDQNKGSPNTTSESQGTRVPPDCRPTKNSVVAVAINTTPSQSMSFNLAVGTLESRSA
jgi:hypothetical protein